MRKILFTAAFFFAVIPVLLFSDQSPWFINLNKYPVYVKVGFDESDPLNYPTKGDDEWQVFSPSEEDDRLIRPVDIEGDQIPRHDFFSMKTYDYMDFTYSIPFDFSKPGTVDVPGLHMAALGDNWRIYLNGTLIRSAVDLGKDGQIEIHHSRRDVFFPVDPALFRHGENLLVLHIMSDPTFEANGFHQTRPFYIDTFEKINEANSSLLTFALLILYLFMGLYHIFLYFSGKNFRYNLFYGLFSADLFLYLFMRTHIVYKLIPDTQLVFKIELISLFAILPLVSAFLELIVENRVNRVTKGYSIFSGALALAVLFTTSNVNLDILRVWQVTGLAMILYIFFYQIFWKFISTARRRWNRQKDQTNSLSKMRIVFRSMGKTAIGNLFIGGVFLVSTAIFDILDSMFFQRDLVLTNYGFLVFTLGSAFVLANRLSFMNKQNSQLNQSLSQKIMEVEKASEESRIAERKYRSLFEGNSDAVLLLSDSFTILDFNMAGMKLLGVHDKESMKSLNIFQSLYHQEGDKNHSRDLFELKMHNVLKVGKPEELNLRFTGKMGETKAVRVRLELIESLSAGRQILFRGVLVQEDVLLDHFIGEKIHYKISNSFPLTEEVSRRITGNLSRYLDKGEAEILYIGLREIIINAVEHGNLHISFDEKTEAQSKGQYIQLLMNRQKEPGYKDKKVKIESSITFEKVMYRISDEGPGFDHETFLKKTMNEVDNSLAHGRGISMAMQLFDTVVYNEKGNQVTLIKNLK